MKKFNYAVTGGLVLLGFCGGLFGNGAKITALITGQNAFSMSAKDLVSGIVP